MSDVAENTIYFVLAILLPLVFPTGIMAWCFHLARKYEEWQSIVLVSSIGAISFPIFRFIQSVGWSIRDTYYDSGVFSENFSSNWTYLSRVTFGESLSYFLEIVYEEILRFDKTLGIDFPLDFNFRIWWINGIVTILFFSVLGILVILAARLWKGKQPRKFLALIFFMVASLLYLAVIGVWMTLERF